MKPCTTEQAARAAGISRATLQFWISEKKVKAPDVQLVDGKAVRLWSQADLAKLTEVKAEIYMKGRGRKPGRKKKGVRRGKR